MFLYPLQGMAQQWVPTQPSAPPEQVGRQAQSYGENIAPSDIGSFSNGNISFPGGEGNISVNDLFPGQQPGQDASRFFPHAPEQTSLEDMSDSDEDMQEIGESSHTSLQADVDSGNPSIQGAAYEVLTGALNMSKPDFNNDPAFDTSRDTYGNMDQIAEEFGDCTTETNYFSSNIDAHVPEYEVCERVEDKSTQCSINHSYDAGVLKHAGGPYNLSSCGEGCVNFWIGQVGDNYWSGSCKIYEQYTRVQIDNPDALTSALLDYAKWDDYMQVWIGPVGEEVKVWQSRSQFPPETSGKCELKESWEQNPNLDLTSYFKNVEPGTVVNFKIRVSVSGDGEGYGRIRLRYDTKKAVTKDEWSPDSCLESALGVADGFAEGEFVCTDDPSDANGCTVINGVQVCEADLKPSPLEGISPMCRKVEVTTEYDFYKGQMECWKNPEGETVCPTNEGGNLNSCKEFEDNPQCGFIKSECVSGAEGDSGTCYVWEDTYDCGGDVSVPTTEQETAYQCGGPIRCMGTDCLDVNRTQSKDFARASALLNAAQFMGNDMSCTGVDENGEVTGTENVTCEIFAGDAGECKKAVGGTVNCCEKPKGLSMQDYLTVLMQVPKLDSAIMGIESQGPLSGLKGTYQVLREPITTGWSHVTKPFTSYMENITSFTDSMTSTVQDFALDAVNTLKEGIAKVTGKAIGNAASSAAGSGAGAAVGQEAVEQGAESFTQQILGEAGATVLGGIMTAYQIYVVSMLVIQMIWECEQAEFELNAKREMKTAHKVGSYCKTEVLGVCIEKREAYCTFNSPLSRIIQEQARAQLGISWGNPKNPSCGGLTVDQIASLDWDRVNLNEWLGMLQANGLYADPNNLQIDALTGMGNELNVDGTRQDIEERTAARFEGIDLDAARTQARDRIENPFD
ncbi:conjugal transfer mating pair stabilization protein TraN [Modicisalibacter xianhensis]|nr:conjugal transfer mating pair stabilization protein TraN [Halomonas xianhensis]